MSCKPLYWPEIYKQAGYFRRLSRHFPYIGLNKQTHNILQDSLSTRTEEDLKCWDIYSSNLQNKARLVSTCLMDNLGWVNSIFLPDDSAQIIFWDYLEDLGSIELIMSIEQALNITLPDNFIETLENKKFIIVIQEIDSLKKVGS